MYYITVYNPKFSSHQMVPESFLKELGGTEFTEDEALRAWKAQCTPFMTNKYRV